MRRKMSQWDDEEEEVTTKPTSFEQAEEDMKKQDDDDKLNSMGDFDANPSVSSFDRYETDRNVVTEGSAEFQ